MTRVSPRASVVVVVSIVLAVLAGAIVVGNAEPAPPALAPITAQELLSKVITAGENATSPLSFSGEASSGVNLGLPQIPAGFGAGSSSNILDLLMNDQTFKVWSSPDGLRIANLLPAAERDLVVNRTDAWFWDSQTQTADHLAFDVSAPHSVQAGSPPDPAELATQTVRGLLPYADLSVSTTQWVAGEPCYTLVLTPMSPTTLIASIQVALDANNWLPLQLEVFAKGSAAPAIRVGFTSISFEPVDAATFEFSPPAGATVTTPASGAPATESDRPPHAKPLTFGTGFDAVVAVPLDEPLPQEAAALLPYAGSLASVIVVRRDGDPWVLAGAVPASVLDATAAQLP